jgi:hypothetical protein
MACSEEGNNTKHTGFLVMMVAVLAVLLAAGCVSSPEKGTSNSGVPANESQSKIRYVQINLLDGTIVGGKYVSETPAFTTIIAMYTMDPKAYTYDANNKFVKDPNRYFARGSGAEVSIKNSLINTMVTIDNPTEMIESTMQELNATAVAMKKAADDKAEMYRIAKEKREAAQVKPT